MTQPMHLANPTVCVYDCVLSVMRVESNLIVFLTHTFSLTAACPAPLEVIRSAAGLFLDLNIKIKLRK